MENSGSFDLNVAIARWRQGLGASSAFRRDNLDELESHLRDTVQTLTTKGLDEEEAFLIAVRRLGYAEPLEREFAKVNSTQVWLVRAIWMLTGILLLQVIMPVARIAGFFAFVLARNLLPQSQVHLHRSLAALVILGMAVALVAGAWRLALRRQKFLTEWTQRMLDRPWLATFGLVVLVEALHTLDAATARTSTLGLRPPRGDGSLLGVFPHVQRFIQSIEVWQRPFGSGAMLYSIIQYGPQLALLVTLVVLMRRHRQQNPSIAS